MSFQIDEKKSAEILFRVLSQSGLDFRLKKTGEEGGFFFIDEDGTRRKFTENIFVKRSIKAEAQNIQTKG